MKVLLPALLICLLMLVEVASADQANVFIYHRFNDSRYPSTDISLHDFKAHLELLSQQKFTVLKLGEVVDRLQRGIALPQRCAVITIDDAFRSFLSYGWSLLRSYGYPATLFVSTNSVGDGDYVSWQELKMLLDEGVEIGNHSAGHDHLLDRLPYESDEAWRTRVSADFSRSQRAFEDHLGMHPKLFAYPYGEFDPELIDLVKKAGFTAAFGQQSGVVGGGQDLFSLPRFPAGGAYAAIEEFEGKLFMKRLPVRIVSPDSTVVKGNNPPLLRFYLGQGVDRASLRCYIPGQSECLIKEASGEDGLYEVKASQPITGRRSKYTLTARDVSGKSWCWFSQLWILPSGREVADYPVPR